MNTPNTTHVLQLIDTLDAGGAERVAVNLANQLPGYGYISHLCATRRGGPLVKDLLPEVQYINLSRRSRFDAAALLRLTAYIRKNQIKILHAHSSSLFVARVAATLSGCKLVWHDHSGIGTVGRSKNLYRFFTFRIDGVFSVTHDLAKWAHTGLGIPEDRIKVLPNFINPPRTYIKSNTLPGEADFRVIFVANIRSQKNQLGLLKAFRLVVNKETRAHLILVGAPVEKDYYQQVISEISKQNLEQNVTCLGGRGDVPVILASCAVAILGSASEGFPLVLLEYGWASMPVVVTNVGECAEIVDRGNAGMLVEHGDYQGMAQCILNLLNEPALRKSFGQSLYQRVQKNYSAEQVMNEIIDVYQRILAKGVK